MSDEGKRQNPRHAIDASIVVHSGSDQQLGRCLNLSSGGLCAALEEALGLGSIVDLAVTLVFDTERHSEPLALPARLVWCTALGEGFQVGFQFLTLNDEQHAFVAMFLRFLEEGRDAAQAVTKAKTDVFS